MKEKFELPEFLTVTEAAHIKKESVVQVRKDCLDGKYFVRKPNGENGSWFIETNSFLKFSGLSVEELNKKRNDLFKNSKEIAQLAIDLLEEDIQQEETLLNRKEKELLNFFQKLEKSYEEYLKQANFQKASEIAAQLAVIRTTLSILGITIEGISN